jgi:hypothetical protein
MKITEGGERERLGDEEMKRDDDMRTEREREDEGEEDGDEEAKERRRDGGERGEDL